LAFPSTLRLGVSKYALTWRFHRLNISEIFLEFTSNWGGSLKLPDSEIAICKLVSRQCHHVDLSSV
jgi:hypothetical protein